MDKLGKIWETLIEVGQTPLQKLEGSLQRHGVAESKAEDASGNVVKLEEARCNNIIDVDYIRSNQTVAADNKTFRAPISNWLLICMMDR